MAKKKIYGQQAYDINIERGIIVDKEDEDLLSDYLWYIAHGCYAATNVTDEDKSRNSTITLHRVIGNRMNFPSHHVICPKNGNFKDCRRSNLQSFTRSDFEKNKKLQRTKFEKISSNVKGIQRDNRRNLWVVCVTRNGVRYNAGSYEDLTDAKIALGKLMELIESEKQTKN